MEFYSQAKMQQPGQNTPPLICDQIVWFIKNSNINFQLQETPYSLNIQIKKSFLNRWGENQNIDTPAYQTQFQDDEHKKQLEVLEMKLKDTLIELKNAQEQRQKDIFDHEATKV